METFQQEMYQVEKQSGPYFGTSILMVKQLAFLPRKTMRLQVKNKCDIFTSVLNLHLYQATLPYTNEKCTALFIYFCRFISPFLKIKMPSKIKDKHLV